MYTNFFQSTSRHATTIYLRELRKNTSEKTDKYLQYTHN